MIATIILLYFILTRFFEVDKRDLLIFYIFIGVIYVALIVVHIVISGGIDLSMSLLLFFI
jgi:hypothetical protein